MSEFKGRVQDMFSCLSDDLTDDEKIEYVRMRQNLNNQIGYQAYDPIVVACTMINVQLFSDINHKKVETSDAIYTLFPEINMFTKVVVLPYKFRGNKWDTVVMEPFYARPPLDGKVSWSAPEIKSIPLHDLGHIKVGYDEETNTVYISNKVKWKTSYKTIGE